MEINNNIHLVELRKYFIDIEKFRLPPFLLKFRLIIHEGITELIHK